MWAIQEGTQNVYLPVSFVDASGIPVEDVTAASAGIEFKIQRLGFAPITADDSDVTDGTAEDIATDPHTDWQLFHLGHGEYRLDYPDSLCAAGMPTGKKFIKCTGKTDDAYMIPFVIQLTAGEPGANEFNLLDGAITGAKIADSGVAKLLEGLIIGKGTVGAVGNDTTHAHLDGMGHADDGLNEYLFALFDVSTGLYHGRWITDWDLSDELATLHTALPAAPTNGDTYWVWNVRRDGLNASTIAAAVLAAAAADPVHANIKEVIDLPLSAAGEGGQEIGETP